MKRYSGDKDFNKLIRSTVKSKVWTFERGSKHGALRNANGHKLMIPCSPSDRRAILNFQRDLKRYV